MSFWRTILEHSVWTADAPFGMFAGGAVIPADRDVNLCIDAFFAADLQHSSDQIRLQIRMRDAKG